MQFLWTPVLWALVLVPLVLGVYIWRQTRRTQYAARFSSLSLVRPVMSRSTWVRRHLPAALFLLGLTAALIGLARPAALVRAPSQQGLVVLAMDSSGSMRADDVVPNRFEAALAAAGKFIDTRPADAEIAIVAFAASAAIVQTATRDKDELHSALQRLDMQRGTAVGSAILESMDAIALSGDLDAAVTAPGEDEIPLPALEPVPPGTYIPALVILLTDGQNRNGPDPIEAAALAAERGVRVYTIGVGTTEGVVIQGGPFGGGGGGGFPSELDEESLKEIAAMTGGEYYYAKDATDLERIYTDMGMNIVLRLDKHELTVYFTLAALLILGTALLLRLWWNPL